MVPGVVVSAALAQIFTAATSALCITDASFSKNPIGHAMSGGTGSSIGVHGLDSSFFFCTLSFITTPSFAQSG
jgi:hypothetical protein